MMWPDPTETDAQDVLFGGVCSLLPLRTGYGDWQQAELRNRKLFVAMACFARAIF